MEPLLTFIDADHGETLKDNIADATKRFAVDLTGQLGDFAKNIVIQVTNMEPLLTFINGAHGETLKDDIANAMKRFAADQMRQLVGSFKNIVIQAANMETGDSTIVTDSAEETYYIFQMDKKECFFPTPIDIAYLKNVCVKKAFLYLYDRIILTQCPAELR
jgi:hypothetical protein